MQTKTHRYLCTLGAVSAVVIAAVFASVTAARGRPAPSDIHTEAGSGCHDRALPIGTSWGDDGEPSLRTDPVDPRRLVASWTKDYGRPGKVAHASAGIPSPTSPILGSVVLAQRDADGMWSRQVVSAEGGDTWLDFSAKGTAYLSYIGSPNVGLAMQLRRVIPGQPAGPPLTPPFTWWDHPAVAVDQRTFAAGDRLYLVGGVESLYLAVSEDGGKHWGPELPFPAPYPSGIGAVVVTGGDRVLVGWEDGAIRVARYDDVEQGFTAATTLSVLEYGDDLPFGAHSVPSLAVARSGSFAGTAYATWAQVTDPESGPDVFVSVSRDGETWSAPQQVNDDPHPESIQVYPSVSVRPDGTAVIAWMDSRDDPLGQSLRMYVASVDPQGNVAPNRRITRCPSFDETMKGYTAIHSYGDYFNFDASQGKVDLIFPQIRTQGGDSDVFYESLARPSPPSCGKKCPYIEQLGP